MVIHTPITTEQALDIVRGRRDMLPSERNVDSTYSFGPGCVNCGQEFLKCFMTPCPGEPPPTEGEVLIP